MRRNGPVVAVILAVALCAPGSASAQSRAHSFGDIAFEASAISFVGLNVADYISTRVALRYPSLHEGNPYLKNIVKDPAAFALIKAATALGGYFGLKSLYKANRPLAWIMSAAANFVLGYVVAHNFKMIRGARAR